MAAAAALVVMAGFAALFSTAPSLKLSRDADRVREQLLLTEPVPAPPVPHPRVHIPARAARLPSLQGAWPSVPPPISSPLPGSGGYSSQDYLDERARDQAGTLKEQVTGSELKRELGKPAEQQALPDNQSYRTVDGQKVVRGGGGCAEVHTVQGSSSPTNRIDVAAPISCPGGSPNTSREMGKALDDWAKHTHQAQPPPP